MPALPFGNARSAGATRWYASLRVRLAVAIALLVALTGIGASWLAIRLARQALVEEVTGIVARATTHAVNALAASPGPLTAEDATTTLRVLGEEISEVETLSLVQVTNGQPRVLALTGPSPGRRARHSRRARSRRAG
jgi:anti-sigma factor RsiW